MKKSFYTYESSYKGYHLLYNGLKATCIVLSSSEYLEYVNFCCDPAMTSELLRLGFYVDDDCNELNEVIKAAQKAHDEDDQHFYRIYTTTACNANCPYCYEKDLPITHLSFEKADSLLLFITSRLQTGEKLGIEWFGGEPLLNTPIISYISDKIISYCKERNIRYWSRIITNGLLLSHSVIDKMVGLWEIKHVQITLDGMKKTYESVKGFKQPDTFELVLDNIEALLRREIRVTVRLNYDCNSIDEIILLIQELAKRYRSYSRFKVYCKHIMSDNTDNSAIASEKTDIRILEELENSGFIRSFINTIPMRTNTCVAHMKRSFMVLPDGTIGKCSQAIAKGDIVGSINGVSEDKLQRWCTTQLPQKCVRCSVLPLCQGGCLFERFMEKPYCFVSSKVIDFKLYRYLVRHIDGCDKNDAT